VATRAAVKEMTARAGIQRRLWGARMGKSQMFCWSQRIFFGRRPTLTRRSPGSCAQEEAGGFCGGESGVDAAGEVYLTGSTERVFSVPTTPGAFQTTAAGTSAFVSKLNATGSALEYSTYLAGANSPRWASGATVRSRDKTRTTAGVGLFER
jgi:hypothetical protein